MADAVLRHLFAGFVRLHVLYHGDKEPIRGVEIMEELRHHGYKIGPGTLYPMLHALQKSGHLTCSEEVVAGKGRKNFRITAAGKGCWRKRGPSCESLQTKSWTTSTGVNLAI